MAAVSPQGDKPKPPPKPVIHNTTTDGCKTNVAAVSNRRHCIDITYTSSCVKQQSSILVDTRSNVEDQSVTKHELVNSAQSLFISKKANEHSSYCTVPSKIIKPPLLPKPQNIPSAKSSSLSPVLELGKPQSDNVLLSLAEISRNSTIFSTAKKAYLSSTVSKNVGMSSSPSYVMTNEDNGISNCNVSTKIRNCSIVAQTNYEHDARKYSFTTSQVENDIDRMKLNENYNRDSLNSKHHFLDEGTYFVCNNSYRSSNTSALSNSTKPDSVKNKNMLPDILQEVPCNIEVKITNEDDRSAEEYKTDCNTDACEQVTIEITEGSKEDLKRYSGSDASFRVDLSRSSSVSGSDSLSFKISPKSSNSGSPIIKKSNMNLDIEPRRIDSQNFEDTDLTEDSSFDSSYSVSRRIKTWFGSFGKGGGSMRRKKRDSTFYLDPEDDVEAINVSTWDTCSFSSVEDRNIGEGTTYLRNEEQLPEMLDKTDSTSDKEADDSNTILNNETESLIENKKERKAYYVVKELISSEKVFIDVLKLLCTDFKNFIESVDENNPVISEFDLMKIINYLPQLLSFNEDLLRDLEARVNDWVTFPKISDIIIKKGPFLKLYSTYIQNFEKQCNFLDEFCHKYPRFLKAVRDFEASDRCKKLTVKHYMLKPVQRIPQYRLLLHDYLERQDADSVDYKDTEHALRIMCDVADHANKSIEQDAHLSKLLQIQSQLGNYEIIKPGREFIKAGELYKLSRKGMQLRYFILLNDCLLYTSYYGSMISLRVNYELQLNGMKICVPQIEDYHNEFSIISVTRSFTLRARTEEEREQWITVLDETIKEHNKRQLSFVSTKLVSQNILPQPITLGREAPVWVPDQRVTMCQVCTAEFKVTFRRHHCRACGKVVCGMCSDNKAPLQYMNFHVARVCDDCYDYLLKEFQESDIFDLVKSQFRLTNENDIITIIKNVRTSFKKHDSDTTRKFQKYIPKRLKEVTANDTGSKMSGWLYRKTRRSWKRYWFVLKEQVLYVYKASEDVKALETIPVLGYTVETFKLGCNSYEDIDSKCVFQLAHANQQPVVFHSDNEYIADRWVMALQEATNLG